jgi:uncharacterized membrane protein YcaP (DUF421 family)
VPDLSQLSAVNLIGNLVFGSIGFVAFIYGKKQNLWKTMFTGLALMIFPYFIAETVAMYAAGTVGTALLFLLRE